MAISCTTELGIVPVKTGTICWMIAWSAATGFAATPPWQTATAVG